MINKHKSNKIKENSNTVRHLNNWTDHRHSKSRCDQSSPARRTIITSALKENRRKAWLKVQYLVIWYPNESLPHLYKLCLVKFRTRILLISVNMIYTNEPDFRCDTNYQGAAHWVKPFRHFALVLKLLSSDRSQTLRDSRSELLNTQKIAINSHRNDGYPANGGKF